MAEVCPQQTLWITELFWLDVTFALTLRNVRLTGQKLVWSECEAEWCTHCLVPPYLWPGEVDSTLIDGHSAAQEEDPFYERSQCWTRSFSFFVVYSGHLLIENSALDNIRVRADSFILLGDKSHLTILNTSITNMDFTSGFIGGSSEEIVLQGLVVSGFNRDHAYSSQYYEPDSGLFRLSWVQSLIWTDSLCEDNLMFAGRGFGVPDHTTSFFGVADFASATLHNNTFRRSMHSFTFYSANEGVLAVTNCTFSREFAGSHSYLEMGRLGKLIAKVEDSLFLDVISSYGSTILIQVNEGELVISRTQFLNVSMYIPIGGFFYGASLALLYMLVPSTTLDQVFIHNAQVGEPGVPSLLGDLLAAGLLNPCAAVDEDYLMVSSRPCHAFLSFRDWTNVHLNNVTITENSECESAVYLLDATGSSVSLILNDLTVKKNINYGLLTEQLQCPFQGSVQHSFFEGSRKSAIAVGDSDKFVFALELRYCQFVETGAGVQFIGSSLRIVECEFMGMRGSSGAIEYKVEAASTETEFQALLIISKSTFTNNTGDLANDISLKATSFSTHLKLDIGESTFTTRETQGAAIILQSVIISNSSIRSCQFVGYQPDAESAVIATAHLQGALTLEDVLFSEIVIPNAYIILATSPSPLTLDHVTLDHSVFLAGIKLASASLQTFHCNFHDNEGVVIWAQGGSLHDHDSVFAANQADGYPCYFQDQQTSAVFEGTYFLGNRARELPGGCVYLRKPRSSAVFRNCTFEGNTAASWGGVMKVENSALLVIDNCLFLNNSAKNAAVLHVSNVRVPLKLLNSVFRGNHGQGTLQIFDSTEVYLANVSMINESGLVLIASVLTADHSSFLQTQGLQGCLLQARFTSTVLMRDCEVAQLHCLTVLEASYQSSLVLISSLFHHLNATSSVVSAATGTVLASMCSVHAINATAFLSLQSTSFTLTSSNFSSINGLVILSQASSFLLLSHSTFTNITSESEAGWLHCSSAGTVQLKDLSVERVSSKQRGAFISTLELTIDACLFSEMSGVLGALFIQATSANLTNSTFIRNRGRSEDSEGGAIAIATLSALIGNCSFEGNRAYAGGAVLWSLTPPVLVGNRFVGNEAFYGPKIASYTTHLRVLNRSTVLMTSGQVFRNRVQVGVFDHTNQLLTRNNSKAELQGNQLSGTLLATARRGVLTFTGFIATYTPGSSTSLAVQLGTLTTQFRSVLRPCVRGEVLYNSTCFVCNQGTYSVELNGTSCAKCPSGGTCPGDGHLYPLAGTWRPSEAYPGLIVCPNAAACIGNGNLSSRIGVCAEAYEGNLCQHCAEGTGRSSGDKCAGCPSSEINRLLICLVVFGVFLLIAFLTRSALNTAKKRASITSVLLKIFLNYTQMMVLVTQFPLQWPVALKDFYVFHEFSGNSGEQVMSLDCLVTDVFYQKAVAAAVLPIVIVLINGVIWGLLGCMLLIAGHPPHLQVKLVCSTIVSLFYFHPMITRAALSCFQCITLSPGQQWLRMELSLPCWDQRHTAIALGAALPTVILWSVGIPALALLVLFKRRKELKHSKVRSMVGFLCDGYQPQFYYWEVVVIYRKIALAALCVFMTNEPVKEQVLTFVLLVTAVTLLHLKYSPFVSILLNRAELLSPCHSIPWPLLRP